MCCKCQASFEMQSLAKFLSRDAWGELEEARIDSKIQMRDEKLSHEFDKRLEEKLENSWLTMVLCLE